MKRFIQSYWKLMLVLLFAAAVYLLWGGITLTIRNQSTYDICEVYYSLDPIEEEGGSSIPMFNAIHARQSRDLHLPVFLNWFQAGSENELFVRSVRCNGEIVDHWQLDLSEGNYFMKEIR